MVTQNLRPKKSWYKEQELKQRIENLHLDPKVRIRSSLNLHSEVHLMPSLKHKFVDNTTKSIITRPLNKNSPYQFPETKSITELTEPQFSIRLHEVESVRSDHRPNQSVDLPQKRRKWFFSNLFSP